MSDTYDDFDVYVSEHDRGRSDDSDGVSYVKEIIGADIAPITRRPRVESEADELAAKVVAYGRQLIADNANIPRYELMQAFEAAYGAALCDIATEMLKLEEDMETMLDDYEGLPC